MVGAGFVAPAALAAVAAGGVAVVVALLLIVAALHRRALARVPIRIHVAGTRGKSTVTRLVAAGLRAQGHRVLARTTGTLPRLLLPDGSERPWRRAGPASIREYERFMRRAAREGADVVVLECMAIRPELVWACEHLLLRATHTVITNARLDHEEDLGSAPDAVERSLIQAVPAGGVVVAAEEAASELVRARARALGCELREVATEGLSPDAANRRLAGAMCEALGTGEAADRAIREAKLPQRFRLREIEVAGRTLRFADAFACNDVRSLGELWARHAAAASEPVVVLLNARGDRPLRSRAMLQFLARREPEVTLFLAGEGLIWLGRLARRLGFGRITRLRRTDPRAVLLRLAAAAPGAVIWGIGNHQGLGAALGRLLDERRAAC